MNDKSTKRAGMYLIDNKYYPSVTQILSVIDKPALRIWFGKQVYMATALNPSISEQEALAEPTKQSTTAKSRGTAVHDIVEAWENTGKVVGLEGPFQGYARAFESWVDSNDIKIKEHEQTVKSDKYGYAGTLDLLVVVNGDIKPTLIDVKTGKDIYPEAHLQVSAYKQALIEDGVELQDAGILLLQDDGTYKYEQAKDKLKTFLACKVLWEGLNEELIAKANVELNKRLLEELV
jgi:hypothetical protein